MTQYHVSLHRDGASDRQIWGQRGYKELHNFRTPLFTYSLAQWLWTLIPITSAR